MNNRILSLDLGKTHIGIAYYSKPLGVKPLKTFSFTDKFVLRRNLEEVLDDYDPELIVVGDMGNEDELTAFMSLLETLADEHGSELLYWSEYLSSFQVAFQKQQGRNDIGRVDHAHAAAEILHDYLESQKSDI